MISHKIIVPYLIHLEFPKLDFLIIMIPIK